MPRRQRRRIIKGVRLEAGGLLPDEVRVKNWRGGPLRVVSRAPRWAEGLPLRTGSDVEETNLGTQEYVPFGGGFAIPDPLPVEHTDEFPGLWFDVRSGMEGSLLRWASGRLRLRRR